MLCPLCRDTTLEPRYSSGIEIDVCPRCRGLWLDRGELERLLSDADVAPPAPAPAAPPPRARPDDRYDDRRDDRRDDRYDDRYGGRMPPKRKKSKAKRLADLFEDVLDF